MMRSRLVFFLWFAWFLLVYGGYFLSSKEYYLVKINEFLRLMGLGQ
jgi:hypothetical protein